MQPYLLRENLQIPVAEQGRASAILSFSYEATVFLLAATFGALSDADPSLYLAFCGSETP
jgi:hypothetical protein